MLRKIRAAHILFPLHFIVLFLHFLHFNFHFEKKSFLDFYYRHRNTILIFMFYKTRKLPIKKNTNEYKIDDKKKS